jgi:hypothetical protein
MPSFIQGLGAAAALLAALFASPAAADEGGHDHGAPAAVAGPALPRFSAVSDAFELVGVVNGKQLMVYLDRFDDNAPVKGAQVELELGGAKVTLKPHADGEYEGTLAQELPPGVTAVTATVVAGKLNDLLAGDIDVHADTHAAEVHGPGWRRAVAWSLGAMAMLGLVVWVVKRFVAARRSGAGGAL